VSVDNRLVEYWRRQLAGRRRLRVAPPPVRLPDGPVPQQVVGATEARSGEPAAEVPSNVVPMAFEDR
jgi:hypothetical protein